MGLQVIAALAVVISAPVSAPTLIGALCFIQVLYGLLCQYSSKNCLYCPGFCDKMTAWMSRLWVPNPHPGKYDLEKLGWNA
jgi:hypothetical protein